MKIRKWLNRGFAALACACVALGIGLAEKTPGRQASAAGILTPIVYERTNAASIAGSNYQYIQSKLSDTAAPSLKASGEYWGFTVSNLLASETRVRCAFEMAGNVTCWIPGNAIYYLAAADGSVSTYECTGGAQIIMLPGSFSGTVYVKKTTLINYTNAALAANDYKVNGIRWGYDYRQTYAASVALLGIGSANIAADENGTEISEPAAVADLTQAAPSSFIYQGTPTPEAKTAMAAGAKVRRAAESEYAATKEISLAAAPRTNYRIGEQLDRSSGAVKITDVKGMSMQVPFADPRFAVEGFDSSSAGEKTVSVKLGDGAALTFKVRVSDTISSLAVTTLPKTDYYIGDEADWSAGEVTLTYDNGATEKVSFSDSRLIVEGFDPETAGTQTIVVKLTANTAVTDNFEVELVATNIVSIEMKTLPKTRYYLGMDADWSAGVVTVTYDNGSTEDLALSSSAFLVSGFDSSAVAAEQTITVTVASDETITLSFTVCVAEIGAGENVFVYERTNENAVSGSNYQCLDVKVAEKDAPSLRGLGDYWGLGVRNLRPNPTRVRLGFLMAGAVCWIPGNGTFYLAADDGSVSTYESVGNAQIVMIPGNFKGTMYFEKTSLINWSEAPDSVIVKGGYKILGVRFGYDLRQTYEAKIALGGISTADLAADGKTFINSVRALNFDAAETSWTHLGTPSEGVRETMLAAVAVKDVKTAAYETPVSIAMETLPKTQYQVGENADYTAGVVSVVYESGEKEYFSLSDARFTISGFDSSAAGTKTVTVRLAEDITASYEITVAEEEKIEGQYVLIKRTDNSVNPIKTGYFYYNFALPEWKKESKNAVGVGNCLGIRLENIGSDINIRVAFRAHNADDSADATTHRTAQYNNANAFVWFVADGAEEVSSCGFDKTLQSMQIPAGASGTLYLRYDTDFSWKQHTSDYGISHIAVGIDMRGTAKVNLVLKELFDATYTIDADAEYIDALDELDNAAGVNTHFTTDVTLVNNRKLLDFRTIDVAKCAVDSSGKGTIEDMHDVLLLANANYAQWNNFTEALLESELAKVSLEEYDPEDYIPVSLTMKSLPKTAYETGDLADWSAGVVTLAYKSGRTEDILLADGKLTVTGFTSAAPGTVKINVALTTNAEIRTEFEITIEKAGQHGGSSGSDGGDTKVGCKNSCRSVVGSSVALSLIAAAGVALLLWKKRGSR